MSNLFAKMRVIHQILRFKSTKMCNKPLKIIYPHESQSHAKPNLAIEEELLVERKILRNAKKKKASIISDFKTQPIKNILSMSNKIREENNVIVLEGKRLIKDALLCGLSLQNLFYANESYIEDPTISLLPQDKVTMVSEKEMKTWSLLSTCPGIMGIFEKPTTSRENEDPNYPVTVICDNVRDPGNMGSLLRCATAAGCKNILLTKGCVDIWDRKVLRAAAGAHFRLNFENKLLWSDVERIVENFHLYFADIFEDNDGETRNCNGISFYTDVQFSKRKMALIIGGETHGVSEDAKKLVTSKGGFGLAIPMKNNVNSLNSATALGIFLFEIRRQFECDVLK